MSEIVVPIGTRIQRIQQAHANVQRCAGDMLQWALVAGAELAAQKEQTPHGDWLPWIERNVPFSERTARTYMQLHEAREELEAAYRQSGADLSLSSALKLVQKAKPRAPSARELRELLRGTDGDGATLPHREKAWKPSWTDQQVSKWERACEALELLKELVSESRGLFGFGAQDTLRRAAVKARQLASVLDDLAGSF